MPQRQQIYPNLACRLGIHLPSPVQRLHLDWPGMDDLALYIKRDDLIHPVISGNKWRKLKYALSDAMATGVTEIISFGGGHSNHLHALGYACNALGIRLIALVRGDYRQQPTPTLKDLQDWGAQLHFIDKVSYRQRNDPAFVKHWQTAHPGALMIPEGGSQQQALAGVAEICTELTEPFDTIVTPVASGGTLAGLIAAHPQASLLGIGVLKGEGYLEKLVTELLPGAPAASWQIRHQFHFGGYAKAPAELVSFCAQFYQQTGIAIEPVYSGKLFFALKRLIGQGFFATGSRILALHTGGLRPPPH